MSIYTPAAALACYGAARRTSSDPALALACSGCMLNLFNLLPIAPRDGCRTR